MEERDPNIITSGLSRRVVRDGITVQLHICRLETGAEDGVRRMRTRL